jgi:hypothetical protein
VESVPPASPKIVHYMAINRRRLILAGAVVGTGWLVDLSLQLPWVHAWVHAQEESIELTERLKVRKLIERLLSGTDQEAASRELGALIIGSYSVERDLIRTLITEMTFTNTQAPSLREALRPILSARLKTKNAEAILLDLLLQKPAHPEWVILWQQLSLLYAARRSAQKSLNLTEKQMPEFLGALAIALQDEETWEAASTFVQDASEPFGDAVKEARSQARITWDETSEGGKSVLGRLARLSPSDQPSTIRPMAHTVEAMKAALEDDEHFSLWTTPYEVNQLAQAMADHSNEERSRLATEILERVLVREPGWRRALALYRLSNPPLLTPEDPLYVINSPSSDGDIRRAFHFLKPDTKVLSDPITATAAENGLAMLATKPPFSKPEESTLSINLKSQGITNDTVAGAPSIYLQPEGPIEAGQNGRYSLMLNIPSSIGNSYRLSGMNVTMTFPQGMTFLTITASAADAQYGKVIASSISGNVLRFILVGLLNANEYQGGFRQSIADIEALIPANVSGRVWGPGLEPNLAIGYLATSGGGLFTHINVESRTIPVQLRPRNGILPLIQGSYKAPLSSTDDGIAKNQLGLMDVSGPKWVRLAKALRWKIEADDIGDSFIRDTFVAAARFLALQDLQSVKDVIAKSIDPRVVKEARDLLDAITENPINHPQGQMLHPSRTLPTPLLAAS